MNVSHTLPEGPGGGWPRRRAPPTHAKYLRGPMRSRSRPTLGPGQPAGRPARLPAGGGPMRLSGSDPRRRTPLRPARGPGDQRLGLLSLPCPRRDWVLPVLRRHPAVEREPQPTTRMPAGQPLARCLRPGRQSASPPSAFLPSPASGRTLARDDTVAPPPPGCDKHAGRPSGAEHVPEVTGGAHQDVLDGVCEDPADPAPAGPRRPHQRIRTGSISPGQTSGQELNSAACRFGGPDLTYSNGRTA